MSTETTEREKTTDETQPERYVGDIGAILDKILDRLDEQDQRIQELERELNDDEPSRDNDSLDLEDAVIPLFAKKQLLEKGLDVTTEEERAIKLWNNFQDHDTYRNNKWILQTSTALKILDDDVHHTQAHRAMMKLGELGQEYVTYYTPEDNPNKKRHMVEITQEQLQLLKERVRDAKRGGGGS